MGHLLSSVNAAAAETIQPAPERAKMPGVGELVIYHMRAGHGRNGKTFFPAIVQGHGDRDTLMLTVIIDAGDFNDETLVEEIGIGREFHVWERVGAENSQYRAQMKLELAHALKIALNGRAEIKALESAVFGDFDKPKVSIIDIMQDFENRLRAIKTENEELRELIGAAVKIKK